MRPAFCPCPPKLKPLTVNTPLTMIFLVLEEVVARLVEGPLRELARGARRRRHLAEQNALILIRQERFGTRTNNRPIATTMTPYTSEIAPGAPRDMSDPALIAAIHPVEAAIEPAEEASLALVGLRRPWASGGSRTSAGVKISATITDSAIAETMVMENWR